MALPFNPFEKKQQPMKKYSKIKVFEKSPMETTLENVPYKEETISQSLDRNKPVNVQENGSLDSSSTRGKPVISQSLDRNKPVNVQENGSLDSSSTRGKPVISQSLDRDKPVNLTEVIGDEKKFLLFIFKQIQFQNEKETLPISTEILKNEFNKKSKAISNLIERLIKKNLLLITKSARGNASWRIFSLPDKTYKQLKEQEIISQQLACNNPGHKPVERLVKDINSSSIKEELINTTINVPENLQKIISRAEIQKILEKGILTEEDLSLSLEHFSYDIENNLVRAKTSPINLFFGLTRSGQKYRSLKLIDLENKELQEYQNELQKRENENKALKQQQLKAKFQIFILENPDFLENIKKNNKMILNTDILEKIAFEVFQSENGAY